MTRVSFPLLIMAATIATAALRPAPGYAADPVFSGPQAGEPLPPLPVHPMFRGDTSAAENWAAADADAPHQLIVMVHTITRPSVGFVRALMSYAATRTDDGLRGAVVFLGDDQTALRQQLERARHALPTEVPIGIAADGGEGPGSYGLNRNVTLTILVASGGTVKANFALVDPSIPVELPKVLRAVCEVAGGTPPAVETLLPPAMRSGAMRRAAAGRPVAEAKRPAAEAADSADEE